MCVQSWNWRQHNVAEVLLLYYCSLWPYLVIWHICSHTFVFLLKQKARPILGNRMLGDISQSCYYYYYYYKNYEIINMIWNEKQGHNCFMTECHTPQESRQSICRENRLVGLCMIRIFGPSAMRLLLPYFSVLRFLASKSKGFFLFTLLYLSSELKYNLMHHLKL